MKGSPHQPKTLQGADPHGPSAKGLQLLKEEFSCPNLALGENHLPCEAAVLENLDENFTTLPNTFLPGEFDPNGLNQIYEDKILNLALPRYAVINVRKPNQRVRIQKTTLQPQQSQSLNTSAKDLDGNPTPECRYLKSHEGLQALQTRENWLRSLLWSGAALTTLIAAAYSGTLFETLNLWPSRYQLPAIIGWGIPTLLCAGLGALLWQKTLGTLIAHLGRKTLQEVVRFELPGLIPPEIREQIQTLSKSYDDIYLVCDAIHQWQSEGTKLLTDTQKKELDPLIIGEKKGKFFLLGWFDLSAAETRLIRA